MDDGLAAVLGIAVGAFASSATAIGKALPVPKRRKRDPYEPLRTQRQQGAAEFNARFGGAAHERRLAGWRAEGAFLSERDVRRTGEEG